MLGYIGNGPYCYSAWLPGGQRWRPVTAVAVPSHFVAEKLPP